MSVWTLGSHPSVPTCPLHRFTALYLSFLVCKMEVVARGSIAGPCLEGEVVK